MPSANKKENYVIVRKSDGKVIEKFRSSATAISNLNRLKKIYGEDLEIENVSLKN